MGWSSDEPQAIKNGMDASTKILLAIIGCVILIIVIILILLFNIQNNIVELSVNNIIKENYDINKLILKMDGTTYINVEEFAKLVGYEYHRGDYKSFTIEEGKYYVQGSEEAATFYVDDNKICKLPLNQLQEEYREYIVEHTTKMKDDKIYATKEAIAIAFNVSIGEEAKTFKIYTLDYLVKFYNNNVIQWGYSDITDQSFENKKAILYGYIIVNKEKGLYKIIDNQNSREIVPDRYNAIEFSESTQEFLVTNSFGQVGIINLDGTTKIEPTYDSITILDKKDGLYLIEKNEKFGVIKSGNTIVISPEHDNIGLINTISTSTVNNKYFILDTLIPVCQNNKWGAFDKSGNLVINMEYDGFGCFKTIVQLNEVEKEVEPVIVIEKCNGIVVEKAGKYGMIDLTGKELVPIEVESIYAIKNIKDEDSRYFMLYNEKELNVIERLIVAGLIEQTPNGDVENTNSGNTIENNSITVEINNNEIDNKLTNQVTTNEIDNKLTNQVTTNEIN